jgi:hypothetical protein
MHCQKGRQLLLINWSPNHNTAAATQQSIKNNDNDPID